MLSNEMITFQLIDKGTVMKRILREDIENVYFIDNEPNLYSMMSQREVPDTYKPLKKNENIDFDFVKNHTFLIKKNSVER